MRAVQLYHVFSLSHTHVHFSPYYVLLIRVEGGGRGEGGLDSSRLRFRKGVGEAGGEAGSRGGCLGAATAAGRQAQGGCLPSAARNQ